MNIDNTPIRDYGPEPFVVNLDAAAKRNSTFRTALWTGEHLQTVLMSIAIGDDVGLEIHPDVDQMLGIVQGRGVARMLSVNGESKAEYEKILTSIQIAQ